jgi:ribosomal-protein-alanine N-acetyltransferase
MDGKSRTLITPIKRARCRAVQQTPARPPFGDHGRASHDHSQLQTARLRLRRLTADDIPAVVALSCDPRVNAHSPTGPPTAEQAEALTRDFIEDWQRDGIGYWIVELSGDMVGIAGIRLVELDGNSYWNLYYRFSPGVWGQGLAAEAARAALEVAHQRAPARRVLARTRPSNGPASRLALAVGMHREPPLDSDGFLTFATP